MKVSDFSPYRRPLSRLLTLAGLCLLSLPILAASGSYAEREAGQRFIARMQDEHGLEPGTVRELLAGIKPNAEVLRLIAKPAEAKPWHQYRAIFLTDTRIEGGVAFWREHAALLEQAQRDYGVAPEYIVAIIGVETLYGKHAGKFGVLEALATLAFDYPPRSLFFSSELEQFMLLAREEKLDAASLKGSYAGAMGPPQFMPSSWRRLAADGDGDNRRDLIGNWADIIASVAHYFQKQGWQPGGISAVRADFTGSNSPAPAGRLVKETRSLTELAQAGLSPQKELPEDAAVIPVVLQQVDGLEYWIGLDNFRVIARYNISAHYAMAVTQLAAAIRQRRETAP